MKLSTGTEVLFPLSGLSDELEAPRFWAEFGADIKKDTEL